MGRKKLDNKKIIFSFNNETIEVIKSYSKKAGQTQSGFVKKAIQKYKELIDNNESLF